MHKLVIFDIDGTLLDTEVAVLKGLQKCLAIHHNIEVDLKDLTFAVGMAGDEVFGHFGVDDSKGISYKKWIGYIDNFRNDIHIFDGMVPTLDKLQEENVKLAIEAINRYETYFLNTLQSAYNLTLETINYDLYMSGDSNDYGYALSHSSESLLIDEIVSLPSVKDYNYIQKAYTYTSITEDLLTEQAIELLKGEQSDTDFSALLNQFELKIYGIRDDVFNRYIDQNNEISNSSTIPIVVINTNQFLKDNKYMQVNLLKEIDHLTFHSNEYQFNVLGYTSELPMGITYDFLSNNIPVITPLSAIEGMFEQGVFDGGYSNLSLYLTSDDTSTLENEIVNLYQEANSLTMPSIFSLQKSHESQKQLELLISIFAYGFICLITLICLVNVFNTITTSMLLRTREFAMIRSVGMDSKSFNKMIRFESLFYGLKALLYGIPLSIGLMYIVYQILKSNFEIPFTLPWSSFIIAIFGIFIFVGLSMWYSLIQIRKLNIIDALKQENI